MQKPHRCFFSLETLRQIAIKDDEDHASQQGIDDLPLPQPHSQRDDTRYQVFFTPAPGSCMKNESGHRKRRKNANRHHHQPSLQPCRQRDAGADQEHRKSGQIRDQPHERDRDERSAIHVSPPPSPRKPTYRKSRRSPFHSTNIQDKLQRLHTVRQADESA